MSTLLTLNLPWPPSSLWPNRKAGHSYHAAQQDKLRVIRDTHYLFYEKYGSLKLKLFGEVRVTYTFHAPTKRRYDLEGVYGAAKHMTDTIASELGIDDYRFNPIVLQRGAPVTKGCISISIEEM